MPSSPDATEASPRATTDCTPTPFGDLSGRLGVVTGASSGIGRAIAIELAAAGADLILHYARNRDGADQTAEAAKRFGADVVLASADFSDVAFTEQFAANVQGIVQGRGEAAPAFWVNNAGVDLLTTDARRASYAERLRLLLEIDVRSAVLLSRAAAETMRDAGGGAILNIGWDQSERGMGGESGELFAAAKASIQAATRSLAVSYAPAVRINCIAPGWIRTAWGETAPDEWQQRVMDETPLKRWGEPEDIARLARFLLSDDAAYLTGQVVFANGGAER